MNIEELSRKIDRYHREDKKREQRRAERNRKENQGWVAVGAGLAIALTLTKIATASITSGRIIDIIVFSSAAIFLWVIGGRALKEARKIKVE